ncbi:MAG: response regulator, partial [Verrucomicrobiota bacterium]
GIAPADQEKLFQPFSQLDSRLAREYNGAGLGLSLVKHLTDLHGGYVTLASEPGAGTTFRVAVPWRMSAEDSEPIQLTPPPTKPVEPSPAPVNVPTAEAGPPASSPEPQAPPVPEAPKPQTEAATPAPPIPEVDATIAVPPLPLADTTTPAPNVQKPGNEPLDQSSQNTTKTDHNSSETTNATRALIIEDSAECGNQVTALLQTVGIESTIARCGELALEQAAELKPDLIILDLLLPGMSGWRVLEELRKNPGTGDIPVIMVSVLNVPDKALRNGAAAFFNKPLLKSEFLKTIRSLFPESILRGTPQKQEREENEAEAQTPIGQETATPPLQDTATPPLQDTAPEPNPSEPRATRILLADDNPENVNTFTLYLEEHGFDVVHARDGIEAVAMAQSEFPDLILMDIQMPNKDGIEAITEIRKIPALQSIPIIAITALAMPGDRDRCLWAGANHYLAKPIGLKNLLRTIEAIQADIGNVPPANEPAPRPSDQARPVDPPAREPARSIRGAAQLKR